ncbi:MAG: M10 family metallopeptidase C-terminal domain-containing protein, partial [Alphaproteobacteria bacterium]|nr:M10 family metallopeptidase C-terminal domain-containing protein [Alphaproteobacteria bacterium]
DYLAGGAGADQLYGLGGDDGLYGGLGADQLRGGAGRDWFRYESASESTAAAMDRIADFQAGEKIDLSAIDADSIAGGNQAFAFIGSDAFHNVAGELRVSESNGSWFVEGDVDGDGAADLVIQVDTILAHPLGASDFVF